MVVFNIYVYMDISIWTGLVGENCHMVKCTFRKKEKILTEIISLFTFAYFVSEKFEEEKRGR